MKLWSAATACGALLAARFTTAIELDLDDDESIKQAASTVAFEMVSHYYGNTSEGIPGLLGDPYYWWEAGAMFSALIDYWYYTGNDEYNEITTQAMMHQRGDYKDYEPQNQTKSLGNDDQSFWGMAAMTAAEAGYPDPPDDEPGWLALAQAVFNRQAARWDNQTCDGGLRWQIFPFNNGYDYKNSITQGTFFNIAARLYAYTGNETYAEWAERAYDWSVDIGLISGAFQVFDGTDAAIGCSDLNHIQWSYNTGVYMMGAAMMWNKTSGESQDKWRKQVEGLVDGSRFFFYEDTDTMFEIACEPRANCNIDQQSFKAYLARWMAGTAKVAPYTAETIMKRLRGSAIAAAKQCTGGDRGITCGTRWYEDAWDGTYGVGQQMNALEVIQSNLEHLVPGPLSNSTGGTSKGNPDAGTGPDSAASGGGGGGGGGGRGGGSSDPITTGDKAGAGILTTLVVVFVLGGAWWMVA